MTKIRRIVVEIPAGRDDEDALMTAVADAAHDWEPEQRDGWDVSVQATVVTLDEEPAVTVWADHLSHDAEEALFDRVAAAAHALDEPLFCVGRVIP